MNVSNPTKALALDLVAYIVLDVLLTPVAGLETRPPTHLTGIGIALLVVYGVGFLLAILSLFLLFRGSQRAPLVAIVAAALLLPAVIADQTGYLSTLRPPIAIAWIEVAGAFTAVFAIGFALWVLQQQAARNP